MLMLTIIMQLFRRLLVYDSGIKLNLVGGNFSSVVADLFNVCHEFTQHTFKRTATEGEDLVRNLVELSRLFCDFETFRLDVISFVNSGCINARWTGDPSNLNDPGKLQCGVIFHGVETKAADVSFL